MISKVLSADLMLSTCNVINTMNTSNKNHANAELACMPSNSGVNLSCLPIDMPIIRIYVTNAMTGMYISGALMSNFGGTGSACEYLTDQSYVKQQQKKIIFCWKRLCT